MIRGSNNANATPITTKTAFRPWHAGTELSLNLLNFLGVQATGQGPLTLLHKGYKERHCLNFNQQANCPQNKK